MPNFFTDNSDILFLFDHLNMPEIATLQEDNFQSPPNAPGHEYAPRDAADAVDNYRRILAIVGDLSGNRIAPRAEQVDHEGNTLNEDGTVTLHPLVTQNLKDLSQADLMGFTLPRKYGGLFCPNLIYTMANEIVSRADASLMNIFGLQGIAETIHAFADDAICDEYLPRFASGELTGAMVLTEPDAGSDLQAVSLRAFQDEDGTWRLNGVKRFITNGCGEILLTLARSEPDVKDGRGLSLFLNERSERIKVRHLEEKLGIHGSPTCELVFDDAPGKLIGERQLGLIRYVFSLMNGARVGIAAQSLGIAEAAYRVARRYAHQRKQFGVAIEELPAVAEMVTDMRIYLEAARTLTYATSRVCDLEYNTLRVPEMPKEKAAPLDAAETKRRKELARTLKRLNGMLTPMSKYYASEMCVTVATTAIQVLGGSGYMKDYPVERHLRDARITTIYEGTTQLQIVAAVRGVCSGAFEKYIEEFEKATYTDPALTEMARRLAEARQNLGQAIAYTKQKGGNYTDLYGRKLVDSAIALIVGHLFLGQAVSNEHKKAVAKRFINTRLPDLQRDIALICSGDMSALEQFEILAGPMPSA